MIYKIEKNKIIFKKIKLALNLGQMRGLMFYPRSKFNFALIFDRSYEDKINSSLHMFFVFFPIDVLFLNSNKEIVDIKFNFRPFRFYIPKEKARYVIELPCLKKNKQLKIKQKVNW
ncbi:MAG: DUF192 domain-containing protein [Candidatus ainarchaeum sp.]|nr:DUF192 domain-containing protein [Candidatus ainarchaeum sp.]MDD3975926.1 DUF192 domain-containing protein [Candidatus ainarchaeum sp.]